MLTTSDEVEWYRIKSHINNYYNLSFHYHKQNYHATVQAYNYSRGVRIYSVSINDTQSFSRIFCTFYLEFFVFIFMVYFLENLLSFIEKIVKIP